MQGLTHDAAALCSLWVPERGLVACRLDYNYLHTLQNTVEIGF